MSKHIGISPVLATIALLFLFVPPAQALDAGACPAYLNHRLTSLQGNPVNLCQYNGRVLLVVNTASDCGNTPQYAVLEKLYEQLQPRGLTVIGFPANDIGGQEPDSNAEIAKFCRVTYKIKFPLMEKSGVTEANANPLSPT